MINKRDRLIFAFAALMLLAVLLVLAIGSPVSGDAAPTTPTPAPGCPAGQTCHLVFGEDSEFYGLCINGNWQFEMYGADSMLARCVSGGGRR
jgi:hypothetical protein